VIKVLSLTVFFMTSSKADINEPLLFVGLGNPGDKYRSNRHNIGFMVVDQIADDYDFPGFRVKFEGLLSEGRINGRKVILLKPQTYMNESGRSVKAATKFYKIPVDHIFVFHDELDLDPGKLRVKHGGGNAGHNGLKSIQSHMGRPDFWRLRLGIGHPGDKKLVHGYVLKDFSKAEFSSWVPDLLSGLSSHAGLLVSGDSSAYMSKVAAAVA
jgi:PTH1 family peptidyl-tRNA hydrolase